MKRCTQFIYFNTINTRGKEAQIGKKNNSEWEMFIAAFILATRA